MATALEPTPPAVVPPPRERSTDTVADLLRRLGEIDPARVRMDPPPGTATLDDLIWVNERKLGMICEWVEGTLVEKAVGQHESWLTFILIGELYAYLQGNDVGMGYGPDAVLRILPNLGRAPDVAILTWASLPGGRPPARDDRVPAVVPDLAVEVLSFNNTRAEMTRKRGEYFTAGVKLVWEIDPEMRAANVYTAADRVTPVPVGGELDGGDILPGFRLSLQYVFDRAERMGGGR